MNADSARLPPLGCGTTTARGEERMQRPRVRFGPEEKVKRNESKAISVFARAILAGLGCAFVLAAYRVGDAIVGQWSKPVSITVGG
jgi:hypothetical protein